MCNYVRWNGNECLKGLTKTFIDLKAEGVCTCVLRLLDYTALSK